MFNHIYTKVNMEQNEQGEKKKSVGLVRRALTGDTSLVGSARSITNSIKNGAAMVTGTVDILAAGTKKALTAPRVELFEAACQRMSINERDLPKIHNQILLKLYSAFFVGVIGLVMSVNFALFFDVGLLVVLCCMSTALACFGICIQASIQSYFIRKRKLGLEKQWFKDPGEWLPSRMDLSLPILPGDSRLDQRMANALAARSRTSFLVAVVLFGFALVLWQLTPAGGLPGAALLTSLIATSILLRAIRASVIVLQSRTGVDYDLLFWIGNPKAWIPSAKGTSKSSLKQVGISQESETTTKQD
jgi:hypothetical protein